MNHNPSISKVSQLEKDLELVNKKANYYGMLGVKKSSIKILMDSVKKGSLQPLSARESINGVNPASNGKDDLYNMIHT